MSNTIQFIVLSMPFLLEGAIEAWYEKKRNISVNHFWSAVARLALMLLIGIAFHIAGISTWWQAFLFSFFIHFAFFNYYYNGLTGRRWNYLRAVGTDSILAMAPTYVRVFCETLLLVSALMVYYHLPVILGKEFPSWLY